MAKSPIVIECILKIALFCFQTKKKLCDFQLIKDFLNKTTTARFGSPASEGVLSFVWALTVSIYLVGGCGGAFSAGWIADKCGR